MSEMLNLLWDDVSLKNDQKGTYVSIRLSWHKKANIEADCQIYHLVDETAYPCLRVCWLFKDYYDIVRQSNPNLGSGAYVFPSFKISDSGVPHVNWYGKLDQNTVRLQLKTIVESSADLNTGISLHSMRRGGSFYRVLESSERKFNFRELMAWCRWSGAKSCCEYLVTVTG